MVYRVILVSNGVYKKTLHRCKTIETAYNNYHLLKEKNIMIQKKSKNQLLREIQDTVDKFNEKKQIVELMLMEIDDLEKKYNILIEEVKNNK